MTHEKTVAVLGGRGQLGQEICRQLGDRACALDRKALDITDATRVTERLLELNPSVVINAAAYTKVDQAEEHSSHCNAVNATAVATLANLCNRLECPLVHFSTDYVFGGDAARSIPYTEEDAPAPVNIYGKSKLAGEIQAAQCSRHLIVRTCGLYDQHSGHGMTRNFPDIMLRLAEERPVLRVVDDQFCSPSYVPHVARATLFLLTAGHQGTYHVVNQGATTWYRFASELFRLCSKHVQLQPITSAEYPSKARRPDYSVLDPGRYLKLAGPPLPDWKAALKDFVAARNLLPTDCQTTSKSS